MGFVKGGTQMNKYTRAVIIYIIITFLLIMFLLVNITYRNETILEQEDKIINLQIELDNAKEIIDKQHLELINYEVIFNNLTIQDRLEVGK